MLLSLSTACLYGLPLRHTFRLAAEAGFDGVELVMGPEVWLRGPGYVESLSREYGLAILGVHQALMRTSPRGPGAGLMVDALGSALALGCSYIVVHDPAVIRWSVPRAQLWLCTLEACQELGQRGAVRLALENPGRYHDADIHNILAQPATLASFARRHDLDITLDTCHAGTAAMGLCEAYRLLRERTVNVHLSDLKRSRPVIDSHLFDNLFIHHQLPGEGFLPLAALVSELARDGFQGPITIETGLVALKGWSNVQCRLQLARILGYVRSAAARSSASTQQEPCSAP